MYSLETSLLSQALQHFSKKKKRAKSTCQLINVLCKLESWKYFFTEAFYTVLAISVQVSSLTKKKKNTPQKRILLYQFFYHFYYFQGCTQNALLHLIWKTVILTILLTHLFDLKPVLYMANYILGKKRKKLSEMSFWL